MTIKILFMTANPTDTTALRLNEEVREIKTQIRAAQHRASFRIIEEHAVRTTDIIEHLQRHQPHVVHFSGHGSDKGEIFLEDQNGQSQAVSPDALKQLFHLLKNNIQCVVLNACFSEIQAEAISESIDCVIGMNTAISDRAAISFASTFYQTLGFGDSLQHAFDLGRLQIMLDGLNEKNTPRILSAIDIDPNSIYLTNKPSKPIKPSTKYARTLSKTINPERNVPKLLAEFTQNRRGQLRREQGSYEIRLFIKDPPLNTRSVKYKLHKSYSQPIREVLEGEPDFQEYITSYGDYKVEVTLRSGRTQKRISRWLSSALEEHYGSNPDDKIRRAIDDIVEN